MISLSARLIARMNIHRRFAGNCLSLVFTLFVTVGSSADIRVENIVAGLDGYVRAERWAPVTMDLKNEGDDFRGTIQISRGETTFQKTLHLASGSKKKVELLYYHSNFYEPLSYRIVDEKGRTVLKNHIDIRILNYVDNLVLVISSNEYNHQFLNGTQNPWGGKSFVAYLKPDALYEEAIAYSAADAIALGNISPAEVGGAAWKSLVEAIASGGVLVCSAGTSSSVLHNEYLRENLPAISDETEQVNDGGFLAGKWASRSSDPFPQFSIPAQTMRLRPCDRQLAAYPGTADSLIESSPYAKGNIFYFAFDYTRLPAELNLLFASFWNDLVYHPSTGPPSFVIPFRKRLEENPTIQKFLYDVPGLRLPDVKWFALFFFVYLLAIGPLQYGMLRLLKKSTLLWLTFPAIILIFSAASFGYSKLRHSSERQIMQVSITEIFPRLGLQTVYQVFGMATADSGIFDFEAIPQNSFLRKSAFQNFSYQPEPYILSEDLPRRLLGERLKSWTFRTIDAIATEPIASPVRVTISTHNDQLRGSITNETHQDLYDAFFYYNDANCARIGTIPAGGTARFTITLNNRTSVPFALSHLRDLLNLHNPSFPDPHFLFAQTGPPHGALLMNHQSYKTQCRRYLAVYVDIPDAGFTRGWLASRPS